MFPCIPHCRNPSTPLQDHGGRARGAASSIHDHKLVQGTKTGCLFTGQGKFSQGHGGGCARRILSPPAADAGTRMRTAHYTRYSRRLSHEKYRGGMRTAHTHTPCHLTRERGCARRSTQRSSWCHYLAFMIRVSQVLHHSASSATSAMAINLMFSLSSSGCPHRNLRHAVHGGLSTIWVFDDLTDATASTTRRLLEDELVVNLAPGVAGMHPCAAGLQPSFTAPAIIALVCNSAT